MEVQTSVLSEADISRLTSEGSLTFTMSDGLTIPIHHFELKSTTTGAEQSSTVEHETLAIEATEDGVTHSIGTITLDVAEMLMAAAASELESGGTTDDIRLFASAASATAEGRPGATEAIVLLDSIDVASSVQGESDSKTGQQNEPERVCYSSEAEVPQNAELTMTAGTEKCPDDAMAVDAEGGVAVEDDVSSSMVVIDVSQPIHLEQNSLIVVNGQKCVLQQNRETGQLIAFPVREPEKPRKKRGRPKKSDKVENATDKVPAVKANLSDVAMVTSSTAAPDSGLDSTVTALDVVPALCEEAPKQIGFVEMANEAGEIVKRSARKRKSVVLKGYETGKIKSIESDDDDEPVDDKEVDEDVDMDLLLMSKRRGAPLTTKKKTPKKPPQAGRKFIGKGIRREITGRPRGRPRRYHREQRDDSRRQLPLAPSLSTSSPLEPPPGTQSFLIQMRDGQTIMMHVPMTSIPDGVSVQNIAQTIANSLNSSAPDTDEPPVTEAARTIAIPESEMNFLSEMDADVAQANSETPLPDTVNSIVTGVNDDVRTTTERKHSTLLPTAVDTDAAKHEQSELPISIDGVTEEATPTEAEDCGDETLPTLTLVPLMANSADIQKWPIRIGPKASDEELAQLCCRQCGFQSFYSRQYQEHLATHADDVHKCKCCGHLTLTKSELVEHIESQHPTSICAVCNHVVSKPHMMRRHRAKHKDALTSMCDICGKTYKDAYILRVHIKNVHLPAEVIFECSVCAKKFTRKAHLKRHLISHDPEMKLFKCDLCEYRGFSRSDITKHQPIHSDPKHACGVCGKTFRYVRNRDIHQKRHSGQRDYKCGVCDFEGYTFTDIRRHIERRHADPKTILCNKCGQAFKTEQLREEHESSAQCELFSLYESLREPESSEDTAAEPQQSQTRPDNNPPDCGAQTVDSLIVSTTTDEEMGELVAAAAAAAAVAASGGTNHLKILEDVVAI